MFYFCYHLYNYTCINISIICILMIKYSLTKGNDCLLVMDIINETLEMLRNGEHLKYLQKDNVQTSKKCPACKQNKTLDNFHKNQNRHGGYALYCKECAKGRINRWAKENPEKMRSMWSKDKRSRRSLLHSSAPYLLPKEWKQLKKQFDNCCAYCGSDDELFQDHVTPIGIKANDNIIVPVCQKCNSSKNDNDFKTWYQKQSFYDVERFNKVLMISN